ncbi:MAG TPA: hypothetical protein VF981_12760 [Gemmatimonadaceae bacterium]
MNGRTALEGLIMMTVTAATITAFTHWSANLTPVHESTVTGTAHATDVPGDSVAVTIRIENAQAGYAHPWHVHAGGCANAGAVLGDGSRYPLLRVGAERTAAAAARVAGGLVPGSAYSVNVHQSESDESVVSCGDLRTVPSR